MVKKCKGLPLAAMVLGGVMHSKKEEHEWLSIRNNEIWNTWDDQNTILPVLKLSYDHLPSHLKQCFSYCAIFPKDFYFDRETLIQLWTAEGFLQPSKGKNKKPMAMEDTGNECFHVLLQNSFFQDVEKDNFGNVVGGKMHDLIHDLAQSVAGTYECSNRKSILMETGSGKKFRLWFEGDDDNSIVPDAFNTKQNLRTCFARGKSVDQSIIDNVFGAKCLRVLDLSWNSFEKLPPIVGKLKHLRYLNLSRSGLTTLPGSITILYNLQTLILYRCLYLVVLPSDIGSLKKLRYLDLSKTPIKVLPESITALSDLQTLDLHQCYRLEEFPKELYMLTSLRHLPLEGIKYQVMPRGLGRLTCLQTLQQFSVLFDTDGGCGIRELEHLNLLRGDLKILNLENVRDGIHAQRANLKGKSNIEYLILNWDVEKSYGSDNNEVVLEGLQPHPNLKRLEIRCFKGVKLPTWLVNTTTTRISQSLPNLVELKLESCGNCEQLLGLGRLRSLKKLTLSGMRNLEEWEEEEEDASPTTTTYKKSALKSVFPCLEMLDIRYCFNLRITPTLFPSLKDLRIEESNGMGVRSLVRRRNHLTSLTSLNLRNIKELKFLPRDLLQPKLHSLEVLGCRMFQGFVQNEEDEEEMCSLFDASYLRDRLTSLTTLSIEYREQSKCFPVALGCLTSLQYLEIRCWYKDLKSSSSTSPTKEEKKENLFISFHRLRVNGCYNLKAFPQQIQHLTDLQVLEISNMGDMLALPECVGNLSSLRSLRIRDCFQLTYLQSEQVMRGLTSLETLFIDGISETSNSFPVEGIQHLVSLHELHISGNSNLIISSLPNQIQHLTTLRDLKICGLNGLLELPEWLGNLSSLQRLHIENCENLKCLPSDETPHCTVVPVYSRMSSFEETLRNGDRRGMV